MITRVVTVLFLILVVQKPGPKALVNNQGALESCQAENRRLATSNKNLNDATARMKEQLGGLNQQLSTAQAEAARLRGENANLTARLRDLQTRPDALQTQLDSAKQQLQKYQQDYQQLVSSNAELKSQITELTRGYEQRLSALKKESDGYKSNSDQLSTQLKDLQLQLTSQGQSLSAANKNLQTSNQTILDQSKQLISQGQSPNQPEAVLALAKAAQERGSKEGTSSVITCDENGRVHVIRELVIGTLDTDYPKEITPGGTLTLNAVFKPHPIITPGVVAESAARDVINWFIELNYKPQKSQATYDQRTSGLKPERRQVDPNGSDEKWAWTVNAPAEFDLDSSDLIVFADYKMGETTSQPKDIVHEKITFAALKVPGAIVRGFNWLKEYLTWILTILTLAFGIWGTYVKTQKDKLEYELKKKEVPKPSRIE